VLQERTVAFREKEMSVAVEMPPGLVVQADPDLLQVVYENLLGNAAKYGRQGGQVRVGGAVGDRCCELWVWNQGQGVPPDRLDAIFEKFMRMPNAEEQQARGSGLGLFITKSIIERHGGHIRADSEPGQWINFVFTLPCPDALAEQRSEEAQAVAGGLAHDEGGDR